MKLLNNMILRRFENSSTEMHAYNSNSTKRMTTFCSSSAKTSSADSTTVMRAKTERLSSHTKKAWKQLLNLVYSIRIKHNSS
jgi:hypothetical protein